MILRKTALLIVVSLALLAVGQGMALAGPATTGSETGEAAIFDDLGQITEQYNEHVGQAPWFVSDRLADERVEAVVQTADGEIHRYAVTTDDDARITDYRRGDAPWKPTVRVTTDAETLEEIRSADDPATAATAAYDRGDIDVQGVSLGKQTELGIVKAGVAAGKFLGLL